MTRSITIMLVVAICLSVVGIGLLLSLLRDRPPAQVYAYRMVGVMALAAGIVLGFSAAEMWRWSVEG